MRVPAPAHGSLCTIVIDSIMQKHVVMCLTKWLIVCMVACMVGCMVGYMAVWLSKHNTPALGLRPGLRH